MQSETGIKLKAHTELHSKREEKFRAKRNISCSIFSTTMHSIVLYTVEGHCGVKNCTSAEASSDLTVSFPAAVLLAFPIA